MIQGIDFDDKGVVLISDIIAKGLSIDVSVLMGANVANEVAQDQFCEATIGCRKAEHRPLFKTLFDAPTFRINVVSDTVGECAPLPCLLVPLY